MPAPRRSTRRSDLTERKAQSKTDQTMLYVVFGVVGALGLLIGFALMNGDDETPVSGASTNTTNAAAAKSAANAPAVPEDRFTPNSSDPMRAKVEQILRAVQEGDLNEFGRSVSFPQFHDAAVAAAGEGKRWRELDSLGQTMARKQIAESLAADEKTREFMRQANIASFVVMKQTDSHATVQVIQRHMIETDRAQERTVELDKVDGQWFLAGMTATAIQTPQEMQQAATQVRTEEKAKRAMKGLAPIEKQELVADTPADVAAKIEAACRTLADVSATKELRKAKQELATLGKPAIPALLNLIVGHEGLTNRDDAIVIHNAVDALRGVTGEDFGFSPQGIGGVQDPNGDIKQENLLALQRWFGWWKASKGSWTGPRPPADEGEKGS